MRLTLSLFLILVCAPPALAQDAVRDALAGPPDVNQVLPLSGDALTDILTDRQHKGFYDFKRAEEGEYAFTEWVDSDGTSLHIQDGVEVKGRWRAKDNVVCFSYTELNGGCFNIYQRDNCYYAFAVPSRNYVAVIVLDGETPRCEPSVA